MLTSQGCRDRVERLWRSLPASCDALVITSPESLVYLSGYAPSPFVFNMVESAAALILWPGRSVLVADNLLHAVLDRSHADEVVALEWYRARKSAPPRRHSVAQAVAGLLAARDPRRLGVEAMGYAGPLPAEPVFLDAPLRALRRAKDPDEVALIRRSVRAGEAAHAAALERLEPGMTERDAYLLVQAAAVREAGEQVHIYGDFVSGPRCALDRGGPPGSRAIQPGDLFLLDFSVVVHGYRADFTNTFVVGGTPTPRQFELFALCIEALQAGEAALRPGVAARDVDEAVRSTFRARGVDRYFPSHAGHGLGLGHPEPPYLVPESTDTVEPGDVIALEPGLYVPDVGGMRFERNYLVTPEGHETLTHHRLTLVR